MWHKNKNKERKKINKLEGKLVADGAKIGIVAARFNEFIVSKLVGGAMDGLIRHDVKEEDVTVAWVPGAFEIPVVAKKMAKSGKYDAVICLGAVIRGATSHYDYVCNEVSKGVASVSLETEIPVLFGVVTTENIEQAIERAVPARISRRASSCSSFCADSPSPDISGTCRGAPPRRSGGQGRRC